MVTGWPAMVSTIWRSAWYCSSSSGRSSRFMNMNSVRSRPTPSAPASIAISASRGSSTLASRPMRCPSRVTEGSLRRRPSCFSSRSSTSSRRWYSATVAGDGLRMTRPAPPSTMIVVSGAREAQQLGDAEHRRNAERARHDGGVAFLAAQHGREALDGLGVEQGGVGRRQLLRHHDRAGGQVLERLVDASASGCAGCGCRPRARRRRGPRDRGRRARRSPARPC